MLKFCSHCCLDGTAKEITFDEEGVCNFCKQAQQALKEIENEKQNLVERINSIKNPKGTYDCILGLSGGVDSSYALHNLVKLGLRPLAYTVDTGWNKPEADENILKMVEKLKVPFYRYTIDLDKFKDLQSAFLKAGLKNVEVTTDHVLYATIYEMAAKYKVKWIVSGGNVATESIMPSSWGANARDLIHIKDVYKKMTGKKLSGLPLLGLWKWNWLKRKIKIFYLLDYLDYDRKKVEQFLIKEYGFQSTGEKHEENYFTWWFQNFYLFTKFGIDKRKAHYASLINSGQMTRKEAMDLLAERPVYPELGIEQRVLKYPKHEHEDFKQDVWYDRISKIVRLWKFLKVKVSFLRT